MPYDRYRQNDRKICMTDLRTYSLVTASYWGFTLSDGALRMLVLLHFHALGYSPLDLAFLFLLYEAMGIVTNFIGGWIGAKFGLRLTLFAGLSVQIFALCALSALQTEWGTAFSVAYVMGAQALSGIAKDLTKMSSKSAMKLVVADEGRLFKWVSILTGSKNALKGFGFFLGGLLLELLGFQHALWAMAAALFIILFFSVLSVKGDLGKAKSKLAGKDLFSKSRAINILSFARVFLFGARDIWFVVGVPIFFAEQLGWSFDQIGLFMALWVIGYGCIQAILPRLTSKTRDQKSAARATRFWGLILSTLPLIIAAGLIYLPEQSNLILIAGLMVFGAIFAINSSLHSFLIVAISDSDKIALNVGFYYMANAIGRFIGTLLSGLTYQLAGLEACLVISALMLLTAALSASALTKEKAV